MREPGPQLQSPAGMQLGEIEFPISSNSPTLFVALIFLSQKGHKASLQCRRIEPETSPKRRLADSHTRELARHP